MHDVFQSKFLSLKILSLKTNLKTELSNLSTDPWHSAIYWLPVIQTIESLTGLKCRKKKRERIADNLR